MASYNGMFLPEGEDPRLTQPAPRGERAVAMGYLASYRMTLEIKCTGLDHEQLAQRSVPPSSMSLLGLVRHMARVEHHWARRCVEGQPDLPRIYKTEEEPDLDFEGAVPDPGVVADAWATWRAECAHADAVYAAVDLDHLVRWHDEDIEVRDVIVHMIEEYARHCGHADLLRERIDGRTGQ